MIFDCGAVYWTKRLICYTPVQRLDGALLLLLFEQRLHTLRVIAPDIPTRVRVRKQYECGKASYAFKDA